jgi:alcohol dehydrogenase
VAIMLPHVIRYNGPQAGKWYLELTRCTGGFDRALTAETAPSALAEWVEVAAREAGLAGTLTGCGVTTEKIPAIAAAASQQWTAKFNPVDVTVADCERLYESAL